jgi:deoxyribose-phosphate aldolase
MYVDYACYDYALSDNEFKQNIESATKLGVTNISIHPTNISLLKNHNIKIYACIDYPYGLCDTKSRVFLISQAIKAGIGGIDIVAPTKFIVNRKYDKLRDDIRSNLELCQENNIDIRYILEYRVFNHEILAKVCEILKNLGISTVFPSTGHAIDDINDNLIAAKYLNTKSGISVVCNGNIWTNKQIDNIKNSDVYGIRFHHLSSLELFIKNQTI